jgi:hypothetical protein
MPGCRLHGDTVYQKRYEYRDTTTHNPTYEKCSCLRFESAVEVLHGTPSRRPIAVYPTCPSNSGGVTGAASPKV